MTDHGYLITYPHSGNPADPAESRGLSMTSIGYMPYLKPGTTLHSAAVINSRMYQYSTKSSSRQGIYGRCKALAFGDIFGSGIGSVTRRLFGQSTTVREILEQHTLFGIYSRTMPPVIAGRLANQIEAGDRSHFRKAFRGHRQRRIPRLATCHLRSCNKCMDEDLDLLGFTTWRVIHLIPAIAHCPHHGLILLDEGEPRTANNREWKLCLPGEQPTQITSVGAARLHMSDGYAAYLRLWLDAFNGNLTGIKPYPWMLVMDAVVRRFGGVAHARTELSKTITRLWGISIEEIAIAFDIPDGHLFVQAELEQRVQASYVASRLIVVAALDEMRMSPPRCEQEPHHTPLELSEPSPFGSWLSPATQAELRTRTMDANFPPALFRELARDTSRYEIEANVHIDSIMVEKYVETLPDELLETMGKEQTWSAASWLSKELQRRENEWKRRDK